VKKIILTLCAPMLLVACSLVDFLDTDNFNDYGANLDIVLENRCGHDIGEAEIYLTNDKRISTCTLSLEAHAQKRTNLNMRAAQSKDGSYSIKYKIGNALHEEAFGYYTNGFPLEETIRIIISLTGISVE